jgi:hypothetical protein
MLFLNFTTNFVLRSRNFGLWASLILIVGCQQAMTGGIVGGLARVYLPFTWGIPFIVFGYDLAANIQATMTF